MGRRWLYLCNLLGEGASLDVVAVEQDSDLVVARVGGLVGNVVGTITLVINFGWGSSRRSSDSHFDLFTTEGLVGTSLVDGSDSEVEVFDEGVSWPCSRFDVDVVGGSLDRLSVEGDVNVVSSSILRFIAALVGTISKVLNVAFNWASWAVDGNSEGVSSFFHVLTVLVLGLDEEFGREGVKKTWLQTWTIGKGLGCISSWVDVEFDWGVLDVVEEDWVGWVALDNGNVVLSRVGRLVLDGPGTIVVVGDLRRNEVEVRIFNDDIEEISSGLLGGSISKGSVDGEGLWVSGLVASLKSRTIGPALVWTCERH